MDFGENKYDKYLRFEQKVGLRKKKVWWILGTWTTSIPNSWMKEKMSEKYLRLEQKVWLWKKGMTNKYV